MVPLLQGDKVVLSGAPFGAEEGQRTGETISGASGLVGLVDEGEFIFPSSRLQVTVGWSRWERGPSPAAKKGEIIMRTLTCLALAVTLGLAGARVTRADEEKVPLDKVPGEVIDAVKARFPGAK